MPIVLAGQPLDDFRVTWSGEHMLDMLRLSGGRMLVSWPVGVGKSTNIDAVIVSAVEGGEYDLVVVLAPTRRILGERRWIREAPPAGVDVRILRPRPADRCGTDRDRQWKEYEQTLAMLGKNHICAACPHRQECHWPDQYGQNLLGAKVIFGTQTHLERDPYFIDRVTTWAGAKSTLTILDEVNLTLKDYRRHVSKDAMERFLSVLKDSESDFAGFNMHKDWIYLTGLLLNAPTADLRGGGWKMPFAPPEWILRVQNTGHERHGSKFQFLGQDLINFNLSLLESRERQKNGDLTFALVPFLKTDLLVYSGTGVPDFLAFRLGVDLENPFANHTFRHPQTRIYNIASRLGAKRYFKKNEKQILDFFAGLVARRISEGFRPLLIAKKQSLARCAAEVQRRLRELGVTNAQIIYQDWESFDLHAPGIVPMIHYGVIGINLFERFDAAYCLNSFYVSEKELDQVLQDLCASDGQIPLKIETKGIPLRRSVRVIDQNDRYYDVAQLAPAALVQLEQDVVFQAVGRVRPFTLPREIVMFHAGVHPQLEYDQEFTSVDEARRFFGVPSARGRECASVAAQVAEARLEGLTQGATATRVRRSVRTVQRHWGQPDTNPL